MLDTAAAQARAPGPILVAVVGLMTYACALVLEAPKKMEVRWKKTSRQGPRPGTALASLHNGKCAVQGNSSWLGTVAGGEQCRVTLDVRHTERWSKIPFLVNLAVGIAAALNISLLEPSTYSGRLAGVSDRRSSPVARYFGLEQMVPSSCPRPPPEQPLRIVSLRRACSIEKPPTAWPQWCDLCVPRTYACLCVPDWYLGDNGYPREKVCVRRGPQACTAASSSSLAATACRLMFLPGCT